MLTKISVEFLCEIFSSIESLEYTVFAIIGQEETLKTLQSFISALHVTDTTRSLWGGQFIQDKKVSPESIVIVCKRGDFPLITDYAKALDVVYLYNVEGQKPCKEVNLQTDNLDLWGLKVFLT